jgi:hypothetical protein
MEIAMSNEFNSREPVYHENDPKRRIISCPGGTWMAQKHSGDKGSKTWDPWRPFQPATSFERAFKRLYGAAEAMG